jgi:hypothetical protein
MVSGGGIVDSFGLFWMLHHPPVTYLVLREADAEADLVVGLADGPSDVAQLGDRPGVTVGGEGDAVGGHRQVQ